MAAIPIGVWIASSMAATAVGTYVSVKASQDAAKTAQTTGELNAQAAMQHGEENAQAALQQGGENAQAALQQGESQAQIAQRQATASLQQAQTEALAIRRQNERVRGSQRVAFLKSGVTLSGSAQDVIYDSAIEGELEALNAEYRGTVAYNVNQDEAAYARSQGITNAQLYRSRAETDARLYRSGAKTSAALATYEGSSRASAYRSQATGSLLSGIGQMASTMGSYGAYKAKGPSFT
jgi:hypothetical protein